MEVPLEPLETIDRVWASRDEPVRDAAVLLVADSGLIGREERDLEPDERTLPRIARGSPPGGAWASASSLANGLGRRARNW
jgi:hypothetical protein